MCLSSFVISPIPYIPDKISSYPPAISYPLAIIHLLLSNHRFLPGMAVRQNISDSPSAHSNQGLETIAEHIHKSF